MDSHHHSDSSPVTREESTYITDSEAATLCALFTDGLGSGMGYIRIIEMLERQDYDEKVVNRLRDAIIEDGNMLGEAFARYGILDPTARKLIIVAEQQGKLPSTFEHLSAHYSQRHERKKKFLIGMIEPALLIALGFLLAPNIIAGDIDSLIENMNAAEYLMPLAYESGLQIGIFGCVAAVLAMVYMNLPVDMGLRSAARRLWVGLPIPIFNRAARLNSIAMFCRYIQQSISSGLTVHRSLALAAEASNNPSVEKRIHIAQKAIEQGETLATGLREADALPDEIIEYVDVGEESGRLEERLEELAGRYEKRAEEAFRNTRKALIYILRLVVMVVVIAILFLVVLGQFSESLPV